MFNKDRLLLEALEIFSAREVDHFLNIAERENIPIADALVECLLRHVAGLDQEGQDDVWRTLLTAGIIECRTVIFCRKGLQVVRFQTPLAVQYVFEVCGFDYKKYGEKPSVFKTPLAAVGEAISWIKDVEEYNNQP
jgi:hypothetical protein